MSDSAEIDATQFTVYGPWTNDNSACFVLTCALCGQDIIDSDDVVPLSEVVTLATLHACVIPPGTDVAQ